MASREEYDTGLMRFLEEITADTSSGTASEKLAQLTAYSKVRSVLSKLELPGVRVFEGTSFLERYEISLAKEEREVAELDFIIRMENVEIQLDVKSKTSEGPFLTKEDFLRYRSVLERCAKTEEILVVWVNADYPTLNIELGKIQECLSSINGDHWSVPSQLLQPLTEAIKSSFVSFKDFIS